MYEKDSNGIENLINSIPIENENSLFGRFAWGLLGNLKDKYSENILFIEERYWF